MKKNYYFKNKLVARSLCVFSAVMVVMLVSCVRLNTPLPTHPHHAPKAPAQPPKSVRMHVFSHGWHTGVVFSRKDVEQRSHIDWLGELHPGNAKYLEFSWGDERAFRSKTIGAKEIFTALFIPTPSVVHLERFTESPYQHYQYSQLLTFDITPSQLDKMLARIRSSIRKDAKGELLSLGHGIEEDSEFFRATRYYFLTRSCNLWTSSVLQAGGINARATLAPKLMRLLREQEDLKGD